MATGVRRNLYLSYSKDKDIMEYIEPLLQRYDFSSVIRELVRDGIRYRTTPLEKNVLQSSNQPKINIEFKHKEISDEELEDRL